MKKDIGDAALFGFIGGIFGVLITAYMLFATGLITQDTQTIISEQHEPVALFSEVWWQGWIGALSGWAAAIGALLTIRWLRKHFSEMRTQNLISKRNALIALEKEISHKLEIVHETLVLVTNVRNIHHNFIALAENINAAENKIRFINKYLFLHKFSQKGHVDYVRAMNGVFSLSAGSVDFILTYFSKYYAIIGPNPNEYFNELKPGEFNYTVSKFIKDYFSEEFYDLSTEKSGLDEVKKATDEIGTKSYQRIVELEKDLFACISQQEKIAQELL